MKIAFGGLPTAMPAGERSAFLTAVLIAIAHFLAVFYYLYVGWTSGTGQFLALAAISFGLGVLAGFGAILSRRERPAQGIMLVMYALAVSYPPIALLVSGLGAVLGPALMVIGPMSAFHALSQRSSRAIMVVTIVSGLTTLLLDLFGSAARPALVGAFIPLLALLVTGVLAFLVFRQFRDYSLRTKLVISLVGITLISVAIVGVISSSISSAQINEQVGTNLSAVTSSLAREIAELVSNDVDILSALSLNKFIQDTVAIANTDGSSDQAYFDRIDQEWKNAADNDPLITGILKNELADDLVEFQSRFPGFLEIFVTDQYGAIIASTNRTSDYYQADEEWWQVAWNNGSGRVYVSQATFDESANAYAIDIAVPISTHNDSTPIGVLRSTIDINILENLIASVQLGQTGQADLVFQGDQYLDPDGLGLTTLAPEDVAGLASLSETYGQRTFEDSLTLVSKSKVSAPLSKHHEVIEQLGWTVVVHQDIAEAHESVAATTRSISLAGIVIALVIAVVAQILAQILVGPISRLTVVADQVTAGDLQARANVEAADEIGSLATAFNTMTSRLHEFIANLESRVAERTGGLVLAAEVGRSVSQVRELHLMLQDAAEIVRSRFDLYYVQVYLTDPAQSALILEAGTGTVGTELVARGHRLPVNTASINGRAAMEKHSVVIPDTSASTTFKPNPLLPDTRSEMAVPLLVGEKVVGVLDLQSQNPGALNQDILPAFEALAGQLAIAIQNANLLAEAQQARLEVESQAGRLVRKNWQEHLDAIHQPERIGFVFEGNAVIPLADAADIKPPSEGNIIQAPVAITGESLGTLSVELDARDLTAQTAELVNNVARQVAQQIENLRLLESAERYRYEAEQATRRLTIEGWKSYMESRSGENLGYLYDLKQVQPVEAEQLPAQDVITLPLKARDEQVGTLTIQDLAPDDRDALELAEAVAERLGAHLESLRLLENTRQGQLELDQRARQLAAVAEVSTASSRELDIQKMLESVVHLTQRKFDLYHAHIFLCDEMTGELRITACGWMEGAEHEGTHGTAPIPLQQEQSLVSRAARTRQPVIVNNVRSDAGWLPNPLLPDTQAEMAIPLVIGDQVLGVLDVQSDRLNAFSEEDANIQTTLASQVAAALQNARSFARAQKQAKQESMLNAISQKIQTATTVEAVLQIAARELGHALGAPLTIAQLGVKANGNGNGPARDS